MLLARVRRALVLVALVIAAMGGAGAAWAQQVAWSDLTPEQKVALLPLIGQWSRLTPDQQRDWMAVSRRYSRMSDEQRKILQDRMTEWAALTPSQRNQARFNFNSIKSSLSAQERRAKWEEYNKLSPAEKERLAKKRRVPRGTAPALQPPSPELLVKPPASPQVAASATEPAPGVYGAPRMVPHAAIPDDRNTLLPKFKK